MAQQFRQKKNGQSGAGQDVAGRIEGAERHPEGGGAAVEGAAGALEGASSTLSTNDSSAQQVRGAYGGMSAILARAASSGTTGAPVVEDAGLEDEADRMGALAAQGLPVRDDASTGAAPAVQQKTIQRKASDKPASLNARLLEASGDEEITAAAREALIELKPKSYDKIASAVKDLSDEAVLRMLRYAPDEFKGSVVLSQVIVGLGGERASSYMDLLTGKLAWVNTKSEEDGVTDFLLTLPGGNRALVLMTEQVSTKTQLHIVNRLPSGSNLSPDQAALLKDIFDFAPDAQVDLLQKAFGRRFNLQVGAASKEEKGIKWEAGGLRRAWPVLEALPPEAVQDNKKLNTFLRYKVDEGDAAEGWYWEHGAETAFGYDPKTLQQQGDGSTAEEGDPLYGVNMFDTAVRHEVGHAVDAQLKVSATHGKESMFGGWKEYGSSYEKVAREMIEQAAGPLSKLPGKRKDWVVRQFVKAMEQREDKHIHMKITEQKWYWKEIAEGDRFNLLMDGAFFSLATGLKKPWYNSPDGGEVLSGRIYQESYDNEWVSYEADARKRRVSAYQFRAPGEWFAEAYATYYAPHPKGNGALLEASDQGLKAWFDKNVAKVDEKKAKNAAVLEQGKQNAQGSQKRPNAAAA